MAALMSVSWGRQWRLLLAMGCLVLLGAWTEKARAHTLTGSFAGYPDGSVVDLRHGGFDGQLDFSPTVVLAPYDDVLYNVSTNVFFTRLGVPFTGPGFSIYSVFYPESNGVYGFYLFVSVIPSLTGSVWQIDEVYTGYFNNRPEGSLAPPFISDTDLGVGIIPIPEPSKWAMILLGFAGVGFARYRRGHGRVRAGKGVVA